MITLNNKLLCTAVAPAIKVVNSLLQNYYGGIFGTYICNCDINFNKLLEQNQISDMESSYVTFYISSNYILFFTCLLFKSDFDLLVDLFLFPFVGETLLGGAIVTGISSVTLQLRGLS